MATKDGFRLVPADRAETPDRAEKPEQPGFATAWRREMIKAGVLGATAAAIALAVVSFETPSALVTSATAFFASLSASQDGKVEQVPIVQSSAEIQSGAGVQSSAEAPASPAAASQQATSAPTASETTPSEPKASEPPADNNVTAPVKTADQGQPGTGQATTEDLLGRFQAWAARDNAQAEAQPAQPAPVQPAPAQPEQATVQATGQESAQVTQAKPDPVQDAGPAQDARAEVETVPNHRAVRRVKHAGTEVRAKQDHNEDRKPDHRTQLRREQNARLQAQRVQDIREQERPQERPIVQPTRPPSFLESLGFRE
jgi:hypothetical protein